jgi:hypothetical protein
MKYCEISIKPVNCIKYNDPSKLMNGLFTSIGTVEECNCINNNIKTDQKVIFSAKIKNRNENIQMSQDFLFFDEELINNIQYQSLFPLFSIGIELIRKLNLNFGENIILLGYTPLNYCLFLLFLKSGIFPYITATVFDSKNIKYHFQKQYSKYSLEKISDSLRVNSFIDKIVITFSEILDINLLNFIKENYDNIKCLYVTENIIIPKEFHIPIEIQTVYVESSNKNINEKFYPYNYVRWDPKRNKELLCNLFVRNQLDFQGFKIATDINKENYDILIS